MRIIWRVRLKLDASRSVDLTPIRLQSRNHSTKHSTIECGHRWVKSQNGSTRSCREEPRLQGRSTRSKSIAQGLRRRWNGCQKTRRRRKRQPRSKVRRICGVSAGGRHADRLSLAAAPPPRHEETVQTLKQTLENLKEIRRVSLSTVGDGPSLMIFFSRRRHRSTSTERNAQKSSKSKSLRFRHEVASCFFHLYHPRNVYRARHLPSFSCSWTTYHLSCKSLSLARRATLRT